MGDVVRSPTGPTERRPDSGRSRRWAQLADRLKSLPSANDCPAFGGANHELTLHRAAISLHAAGSRHAASARIVAAHWSASGADHAGRHWSAVADHRRCQLLCCSRTLSAFSSVRAGQEKAASVSTVVAGRRLGFAARSLNSLVARRLLWRRMVTALAVVSRCCARCGKQNITRPGTSHGTPCSGVPDQTARGSTGR